MHKFSKSLRGRFWSKVEKGQEEQCWMWMGASEKNGYGRINRGRKGWGIERAHRVSWMIHFGPIADGMHVLHKCDVGRCVNPKHLFAGTNSDNIRDKVAKGRSHKLHGTLCARSKLTDYEVMKIRETLYKRQATRRELATKHSVVYTTISNVERGLTWKHLPLGGTAA